MGLLPGSSRGNTEKAVPGDKGGVENGAGRAMVVRGGMKKTWAINTAERPGARAYTYL